MAINPSNPTGSEQADAWSPEEGIAAQEFYQNYIAQHHLTSFGTVDDPLTVYHNLRRQGQDHATAMQGALHQLGWDDPSKWPQTTTPGPTGGTGGPGGPGGLDPGTFRFTTPFNAPAPINLGGPPGIPYIPKTPVFEGPNAPPALGDLPKFSAPTADQALNDPGYQFRVQQGDAGLQNWAAARGTLNDSGTAKALTDYNQNAATQEYDNVWKRAFSTYGSDVNNQLASFGTKYKAWGDTVLTPQMQAYLTQASAGQHQNDVNFQNAWNKWIQDWNIFRDNRDTTIGVATS